MDNKKQIQFLSGPLSRWQEFKYLLDVCYDMVKGMRSLHFVGPCVTIFGSARFNENQEIYKSTMKLSAEIAQLGFTILTGGGPGIMEAANRGAKAVNGRSVGCNISLPFEQKPNPYLDKWVTMDYFFTRKTMLIKYSYAFVVMPGGFGTMDEFFEALTLIQTKKISNFPIVLFDTEYHKHLIEFIADLSRTGAIHSEDLKLILATNSVEDAVNHIRTNIEIKSILSKYNSPTASTWLFEKELVSKP